MGDELQQAEDQAAAEYTELRRQGTSVDDAATYLLGKPFSLGLLRFCSAHYFRQLALQFRRTDRNTSLTLARGAGVRRAAAALGDLKPADALTLVQLGDCPGRKTGES